MYDPKEIHLLSPEVGASEPAAQLPASHLSDEQFTDLLLGTIPALVSAHLAVCIDCAEEAQRVSGAIGNFEQQSRLWAERRASMRPALVPTHRPVMAWLNRPAAWSALAVAIVLAAGVGMTHHNAPRISTQQPMQVASVKNPMKAATQISAATLKQDNDLLSAINGELSADATPPASLYGLKVDTRFPRSHSLKRISN